LPKRRYFKGKTRRRKLRESFRKKAGDRPKDLFSESYIDKRELHLAASRGEGAQGKKESRTLAGKVLAGKTSIGLMGEIREKD